MFSSHRYRRNNYYRAHRAQVNQKRLPQSVPRTYTITDLYNFAEMTNRQGITIPNPDHIPHPVPPVYPPSPEPEEEEEEEKPEPIINYPIEKLLISQDQDTDLKVISYQQCFMTPYITKYNEPLQMNTVQQIFVVIEDPSQFNRPHFFVWISEDFNFEKGEGLFSQFGCQILDNYDTLTTNHQKKFFC